MKICHFQATAMALLTAVTASLTVPPDCQVSPFSAQRFQTIVSNYYAMWNGPDESFLNRTVALDVHQYHDRFASGTGNGSSVVLVNSSSSLWAFIQSARYGFSEYKFEDLFSYGVDNLITARWRLHAVTTGEGPTRRVPKNTTVVYNGTEILTLDRCSGLVVEVASAQDLMDFYHQLRLPLGTV